jgi:hypothetical protein
LPYDTHRGFLGPLLVTTLQGGQSGIVFPFAPVYEATALKLVRINLFLQALSVAADKMKVEVGIQVSEDREIWPTSTTQPTFLATSVNRQSEGTTSIEGFEDITSLLTKRYARIVLWVKNVSPETGLCTCLAAIRVERKAC